MLVVVGMTASATRISDAIRNVGTRSCVIAPRAKKENTPTKKPRTASRMLTGESQLVILVFKVCPRPKTKPTMRAIQTPIRKTQLPIFFYH